MNKQYKVIRQKGDKQNLYILKDNIKMSLRQLSLQDLLIVGIVNKISHFENFIDQEQKIGSYSDLKVALEFCEKLEERVPQSKVIKAIHALDERDLFLRATEYAEMGNCTPLEIAKNFARTEENFRKEKIK